MKKLAIVLFASLLATSAFADNAQGNSSSQSVVNSNVQIGTGNVSSITSVQQQFQSNKAVSQNKGAIAQQSISIQEAINISQQMGQFNASIITSQQTSMQKNLGIILPALPIVDLTKQPKN